MSRFVLFLYALLTISFVKAYELHKQYDASNFFDSFDFINTYDKYTHGRALYVAKYSATSTGLARTIGDQVFLSVDNSSIFDVAPYVGRKSVRVESHDTIDNGIITVDFEHLPANACGMWPAFWLVRDDNEYEYSEIDIIESVSLLSRNEITLYTKPATCTMTAQRGTGDVLSTSCAFDSGCGTQAPDGTFGDAFNRNGGGVWATQIEAEGVRVWFFPRERIPADLESDTPDPDTWGEPVMSFAPRDCDIRRSWREMKIVLNITFCGEYAGGRAWDTYTQCRAVTGVRSCDEFVARNPEAFDDVYFLLNSIKTYNR